MRMAWLVALRRAPWLAAVLGMLAVTGCAALAPRSGAAAAAPEWTDSALAARAAQLHPLIAWQLQGRVAIKRGDQGGSGQLDWQQHGADVRIAFDAPLNAAGWRLQTTAGSTCLDGLAAGRRCADDADTLLADVLGQPVPVAALADWLRGMPADPARFGPATSSTGADGSPILTQAGWRIVYGRWARPPGWPLPMPTLLVASQGDLRLNLAVDRWQIAAQ